MKMKEIGYGRILVNDNLPGGLDSGAGLAMDQISLKLGIELQSIRQVMTLNDSRKDFPVVADGLIKSILTHLSLSLNSK
jgi:hypothetical protein